MHFYIMDKESLGDCLVLSDGGKPPSFLSSTLIIRKHLVYPLSRWLTRKGLEKWIGFDVSRVAGGASRSETRSLPVFGDVVGTLSLSLSPSVSLSLSLSTPSQSAHTR